MATLMENLLAVSLLPILDPSTYIPAFGTEPILFIRVILVVVDDDVVQKHPDVEGFKSAKSKMENPGWVLVFSVQLFGCMPVSRCQSK